MKDEGQKPALCACGCGRPVPAAKPHRPQARYLYGHQARDNSRARRGKIKASGQSARAEKGGGFLDLRNALKKHDLLRKARGELLTPISYCCVMKNEG